MKETKELKKTPMPHDRGYKRSLSNPHEFLHFIRKYIGADWMLELTEDQLSLCDKEFIEKDYEGKEADLLYRVMRRDGQEVLIFILQELQSYVDHTMIFRVLIYVVNSLLRYFLSTNKAERERKEFRLPSMVPIVFYNGEDRWTAARELREYQTGGEGFDTHVLNLEYYLVDLSEIEEEYILSTNTVLDNIMYCDKYRRKLGLVNAVREARRRVGELGAQEQEEFDNWVKHILLSICENKVAVANEILSWAGNGEDDMAFEYTIIREFHKERDKGRVEGRVEGRAEGRVEGRAEGRVEGRAEGRVEGRMEGKAEYLVRLVCKRLQKGKAPGVIAEELEEDQETINALCQTAEAFAPDYDWEKVFAAWREQGMVKYSIN